MEQLCNYYVEYYAIFINDKQWTKIKRITLCKMTIILQRFKSTLKPDFLADCLNFCSALL